LSLDVDKQCSAVESLSTTGDKDSTVRWNRQQQQATPQLSTDLRGMRATLGKLYIDRG
jgi:hypothetical protein